MAKDYEFRHREVYKGVQIDVRAKTQKDLVTKLSEKKNRVDRFGRATFTDMTVREWSDRWMRTYVDGTTGMKTYKDIEFRLEKKILPAIGNMKLTAVRPAHCQEILNAMSGYSLDRINKVNNTMFQLFKKAQSNWLIERNPACDLFKPKAQNGHGRALTPYEQEILLKVCKTHEAGDWALMMLYCGLRPGETANVKWCHLKDGSVYIDGTKTKNAKRTVPVPDDLYTRLNNRRGNPFDYVFKRNGKPLTHSGLTRTWWNIKREMQIVAGTNMVRNQLIPPYKIDDKVIAYCCRHSFATELKDAQMPFTIMQELLGHSTGTITDVYLHSTEKSLDLARRLLAEHRSEHAERKHVKTYK